MANGLTNEYVEKLGRKLLGKKFKGVYPCDSKPLMKKYKYIVFNESKHNEVGTHFVAFGMKKKLIFYFDSLGKSLSNIYLKKFVKSLKKKCICVLNYPIQSDESLFCGLFCIAFLLSLKNNDFTFLSRLNVPNISNNDDKILNYLLKEIKKL